MCTFWLMRFVILGLSISTGLSVRNCHVLSWEYAHARLCISRHRQCQHPSGTGSSQAILSHHFSYSESTTACGAIQGPPSFPYSVSDYSTYIPTWYYTPALVRAGKRVSFLPACCLWRPSTDGLQLITRQKRYW